jgi:hypothetical protein
LPEINGVDDGSIFYVYFCFLTAVKGCQIWRHEYSILGYPPARVVHILGYVLITLVTIATLEKYVINLLICI